MRSFAMVVHALQAGTDRLEAPQDVGMAAEETDHQHPEQEHHEAERDHDGVDPGHTCPARHGAVWLAVKLSDRRVVLQESNN
jgi:hypothetical protein